MSKWGKVYLIATIVAAVVSLGIVLYRETDIFKKIIDGISFAYNWLKYLGKYPIPETPEEIEEPAETVIKCLKMIISH